MITPRLLALSLVGVCAAFAADKAFFAMFEAFIEHAFEEAHAMPGNSIRLRCSTSSIILMPELCG